VSRATAARRGTNQLLQSMCASSPDPVTGGRVCVFDLQEPRCWRKEALMSWLLEHRRLFGLWGRAEMETGQAAMWQWPRGWRMP
jgi:hypothetical protein